MRIENVFIEAYLKDIKILCFFAKFFYQTIEVLF